MIIEMRSYQLKPASIPQFEERFGAALPGRMTFSPLAAFWHTEVGPLNQVIHVWPYDSLDQRMAIRSAAIASGKWPPATSEFIVDMKSEIFIPAPFSPPLEPRELGGIYEIRMYTFAAGAIPGVIARWSEKIGERVKLSPLVGAWHSELGALNKWMHIWAYKDANHRAQVRAEAVAKGIWPPGSAAAGVLLKQENMLVVPAKFSPLR
ncbi:MAG TPA: NIPSNAP family protein [Acetobacteraceae bacterium]|jgi:hypothetical protein|nr:NIPSNAP family protein [Acetobacteraceae bacterium]